MKKVFLIAIIAIAGCTKTSVPATTTTAPVNTTVTNTIVQKLKWNKIDYYVSYKADGVTEASRQEYTYDTEGRTIGLKVYQDGVLTQQLRNYTYVGNEATYYSDYYTSAGVLLYSNKTKTGYNNN
jgi:hypothetical protein